MQQVSIYLNAHASSGASDFWEKEIARILFRSELQFKRASSLEELDSLLNLDIENEVDVIISVGGDGTINTLIQKLVDKKIALFVVPAGTANDLANELGVCVDLGRTLGWIRSKSMRNIDLIDIDGRYMATNGGIGLGGSVAYKINELRKKIPILKILMKVTGKNIYTFFAATHLMSSKITYYDFEIESEQYNGRFIGAGLLVNNQPRLAASFTVAPQTKNNDGRFNVTLFKHKSRAKLIQCLWKMNSGSDFTEDEDIVTFETQELKIKVHGQKKAYFFGDGESLHNKGRNEWHVKIKPSCLNVYCETNLNPINVTNKVSLQ